MKRAFVTFLLLYGTALSAADELSRAEALADALMAINNEIDTCQSRIRELEGYIGRVDGRVDNFENAVRGQEADHANRIERLEADTARLDANVTFLLQQSHYSRGERHRHTQQLTRADQVLARHEGWLNFLMRSMAEQNDRIAQQEAITARQEEGMRQLGEVIEDLDRAIFLIQNRR